jgi:hypothetical protein
MDSIKKLHGANMDIDLASPAGSIAWQQDGCPWNAAEGTQAHRCAVKNVSICPYFCGVEYLDTLLCCYPHENPLRDKA